MRKQKHLDELTARLTQLMATNSEILLTIGFVNQHLVTVEAENAVLLAQATELGQRLVALNEILSYISLGQG